MNKPEIKFLSGMRKIAHEIKDLNQLHEVEQMLAERVDVWMQRGLQQGIEQGIQQGECVVVKRLLEKKFGFLTTEQEIYLQQLNENELLELSVKLLDAQRIEDLFL